MYVCMYVCIEVTDEYGTWYFPVALLDYKKQREGETCGSLNGILAKKSGLDDWYQQ